MSRIDGFDESIKNALEQFEVPYNSADWSKLEEALDKQDRSNGKGGFGFYAALLAGAMVLGGGAYWLNGQLGADDTSISATTTTDTNNGVLPQDGAANADPSLIDGDRSDHVGQDMDGASIDLTEGSAVADLDHSDDNKHRNTDQVDGPGSRTSSSDNQNAANTDRNSPAEHAASNNTESGITTDAGTNNSDATEDKALAFSSTITEGCPGSSVDFNVENMPEDGIYLWNFGDGSFSNKPNPSHVYDKPGSYQVNLSVTTASGGTILNKPASEKIEIFSAPRASFIHQNRIMDGGVPHKHFENRSRNASTWHWNFGDGQTSTEEHPSHVYKSKGVYTVELIATNETGCQDKYTRQVVIDNDYDLGASMAFSPNGDGKDDTFMPEKLRDMKVPFKLSIYEETGRKVFETTDASIGWNGKTNNRGDACVPGEYVWMVEFAEKTAEVEETFNGKVTLLQ